MINPGREQRRFTRVLFEGQALIRTAQHDFTTCTPQNVSTGGACLRIMENLDPRDEVDVQLISTEFPEPVELHGRVRWTTARLDISEQAPVPYDVGIEFTGLSAHMQQALQRMIQHCRARQHVVVT
jgi:hypothetical protein